MNFDCPRGCKRKNGDPVATTIKGWKRHMTSAHGKFTDEELNKVLGTGPIDPEQGRAEFLRDIDAPLETPTPAPEATDVQASAQEKTVEVKTDAVSKKFSGRLNKFKEKLARKIPEALNDVIKEKGPEFLMSDSDVEMFSEAIENCFEVLDIDFRIAPVSKTLTNPLWVLLLPALVCVMIFAPKAVRYAQLKEGGESDGTTAVSSE